MTATQIQELKDYTQQAREYLHNVTTFREDCKIIKDFIDIYGDKVSWENIEKTLANRKISGMNKDALRRCLYRWRMYKQGVPVPYIVDHYVSLGDHARLYTRACEIISCNDRDVDGFCKLHYRQRSSCETLKMLDELARSGLSATMKKEEKAQNPKKADWIFGMKCSYKGSASAVFNGRI